MTDDWDRNRDIENEGQRALMTKLPSQRVATCPFCLVTHQGPHACTASRTVQQTEFRKDPAAVMRLLDDGDVNVLGADGKTRIVLSRPTIEVPCFSCEEDFAELLDALESEVCLFRSEGVVSTTHLGGIRALRLLAKHGRFTIETDDGKSIAGRWAR